MYLLCTCTRLVLSLCTREMLHICVKLEHAYIRNVNVRWTHTYTHTDRHDHRLTDHVGLAQARPNNTLTRDMHATHVVAKTSDMQGMVWGEPELSHVWVFHHMVFFTVIMIMRCE